MQKGRKLAWLPAQQHAFEVLKARLLQAPILVHPDSKKPYLLHMDAFDVVVGATLSQTDAESVVNLVVCRFRKLNEAQKNFPVHEK